MNFQKKRIVQLMALLVAQGLIDLARADTMEDLNASLGGGHSYARAASANGSVIVGGAQQVGGSYRAYSLIGNALTNLGILSGTGSSQAWGVSSDGSIIVGFSGITGGFEHAIKYTGTTMTDLGTLGGSNSWAYGISADGSVIVGQAQTTGNAANRAFKYTGTTMTDLGTLGGTTSVARAASADGSVIVGQAQTTGNAANRAFKYTGTTMTDLGTLGGTNSIAYGISADGSVIVGQAGVTGTSVSHAFKYTGTTMTSLGTLGGTNSNARGVSADGSIIVGDSRITGDGATHAFKYINGTMTDLGTLGGTDSNAWGISADGSVIVGASNITGNTAYHSFVVRNTPTPTPTPAPMVDLDNTVSALSASLYQQSAVLNLQNNLLNVGLNHDCTVFGENNLGLVVGGFNSGFTSPHAAQSNASLTLAYRATPTIRVGGFVDKSVNNSTPSNYALKKDMPMVGGFVAWSGNANGLGAELKASVAYNQRDVNITRSVLANTEAGRGDSQLTSKGAQVEGSFGLPLNGDWTAQPFAGARVTGVKRDAYNETSGADFPIAYNAIEQNASMVYLGSRLAGKLSNKVNVLLTGGVEQDVQQRVSDIKGDIDSVGAVTVSAPKVQHTRAFVKGALNYAVAPGALFNVSLMANQNALSHGVSAVGMATYQIGF